MSRSFAAQQGHSHVVDKLIEHGADVSWSTGAGLTPWMLALDAQRMPDHPTRTDALVSAYDTLMAALVAAGARHGASSDVHLVGSLPMKAIAKAGAESSRRQGRRLRRLSVLLLFAAVVATIGAE